MSQTIDLGKVVPVKGTDYWTPQEAAEMEAAKNGANSAAASANSAAAAATSATSTLSQQAAADHAQAGNDHSQASTDHSTAVSDHTQATNDHTTAAGDHLVVAADHVQAGNDHTQAGTDHSTAASDHSTAASDHSTAASDHTAVTVTWRQEFEAAEGTSSQAASATGSRWQRFLHDKQAWDEIAGSSAIGEYSRDFGKYEALSDITLTLVESGKRIDSKGDIVTDANWAIGRIGASTAGVTYELLMSQASKMVEGTALFVAHTQVTLGQATNDIYTPRLVPAGTAIPASGYVIYEAVQADADLLVCYRIDVTGANVLKARKYESKENVAAAIGERDKEISSLNDDVEELKADLMPINFHSLPLLCGQPMILFGNDTPQEAVVPANWKQYDPETGEGYQWTGLPSAIGQQYINIVAASNGRYIAVDNGNNELTWKNF